MYVKVDGYLYTVQCTQIFKKQQHFIDVTLRVNLDIVRVLLFFFSYTKYL